MPNNRQGENKRLQLPISANSPEYTELFRARFQRNNRHHCPVTNRQTSLMQQWPIRKTGISRDRSRDREQRPTWTHFTRAEQSVRTRERRREEGFRKRERDSIGFGSRSAAVERGRADSRTILGRRGLSWPVRVVSVPRSVASFPVVAFVLSSDGSPRSPPYRHGARDISRRISSSRFFAVPWNEGIFFFIPDGVIYNNKGTRRSSLRM